MLRLGLRKYNYILVFLTIELEPINRDMMTLQKFILGDRTKEETIRVPVC